MEFETEFVIALIKDVNSIPAYEVKYFSIRDEGLELVVNCRGSLHREIAALVHQLRYIDGRDLSKLKKRIGYAGQPQRTAKVLGNTESR